MSRIIIILFTALIAGCQSVSAIENTASSNWRIVYSADREGAVQQGSIDDLFSVIRQGCDIKIAWGGQRRGDPSLTIEHVAEPLWISALDGRKVQARIGGHAANLAFLGTPSPENDRTTAFGGREQVVRWQAEVSTEGDFDAVWYNAVTGELAARRPQRHAMRWISNCAPSSNTPPLFDPAS